jgi:hypothetical protein
VALLSMPHALPHLESGALLRGYVDVGPISQCVVEQFREQRLAQRFEAV